MSYTPSPAEFGAPSKYVEWRDGQDNLFWDILDSKTRFSIHNAPTGMGKTVAYISAALAQGKRVVVITESKALQDQIAKDFGCIGLFDMRGLQNFICHAMAEGGEYEKMWSKKWGKPTCDIGPCTGGIRCDLKDNGCDYFDAYRRACKERLVSTNYAYWIAINKYGQGIGDFDILVLDECHEAMQQLSSAMSVEFNAKDFKELKTKPPKLDAKMQVWRMWGRTQLHRVQGKLDFFARGAKVGGTVDGLATFVADSDLPDAIELKMWKQLEGKCTTLSESTDDWVVDRDESSGNIRIAPVWVSDYAEGYLFQHIKRVVMLSATVRPKIAELMGIAPEDYSFYEYPSTFPVVRRPLYWIKTVTLNHKATEYDMEQWASRIDDILYPRLDRKGIIHTVSFTRQRYLLENSIFRELMHVNSSGNTRDVVKLFREAAPPAILVSPSVGTGFDFPYDAARYQIIGKVPFRDTRGSILQAQLQTDPDYSNYLTSQDLVQIYGRVNRAPDDLSETFIVDDSIEWLVSRYSGWHYDRGVGYFNMREPRIGYDSFFPYYFLEAFQRLDYIPEPLPLDGVIC